MDAALVARGAIMKSEGLQTGRGCRAEGAAGEPQEVRAADPGRNLPAGQAEGKVAAYAGAIAFKSLP